ncbi:helix-turn-helix transcriptional regulator [Flavobacterium sp.]|uniref:helix-turn-helix domain-containing protein n=1 Tax=Flavobacterium sp. TaxID=239 RepID=UPI0025BA73C5|nr:helix-turn-helix transcriptional regulator [Flavobacterium sp.]MBA4155464.1 XRE family transcriptional regulator [Flavobacterium sp.]
MLNTQEIVKKLELIFDYYQLNASSFADKIGVQRSSLSHLLSGRNKPSLEFVIKITECFPEVDLYWFLMNQGDFPKSEKKVVAVPELVNTQKNAELKEVNSFVINQEKHKNNSKSTNSIEKVMIFYTNGTVKSYNYSEE